MYWFNLYIVVNENLICSPFSVLLPFEGVVQIHMNLNESFLPWVLLLLITLSHYDLFLRLLALKSIM
ncbi:predicted protein [Plenodomus lingam JN3]|uniref:Predicted protein n=1 Tax=Leptosphaeria maculans (strain JN3 / isolate v23.1.3 / race Av1-4-5-6-7-8) TaxID=985895 RepID=E4ZQA1_LEPMJ|nr:predicted protein [Plenodomus lingam JN3]CBX90011.1 predicted protein [Plenodomus lingam JN3]